MSICVVVADSSKARILMAEDAHGPLIENSDYLHTESRLHEQDLVSDRPGGGIDTGGYGRHSVGTEHAARQRQAEIFADEVGAEIEKIRRNTDLHRIYLVAPPKFLGLLRSSISKQCSELLYGEVHKELVTHSIEDIRAHLPALL